MIELFTEWQGAVLLAAAVYYFWGAHLFAQLLLSWAPWLGGSSRGPLARVCLLLLRCVLWTSGRRTFGVQDVLPVLGVPSLASSVQGHLASCRPFFDGRDDEEQYAAAARAFERHVDKKHPQALFTERRQVRQHIYEEFSSAWALMQRTALPLASWLLFVSQSNSQSTSQLSPQWRRAAAAIRASARYYGKIHNETLPVDKTADGSAPLCMAQFRCLFSTRVPGSDTDTIVPSKRWCAVVVSPQGHYYALPLRTLQAGQERLLSRAELETALEKICRHAEQARVDSSAVPALTGSPRATWAAVRQEHLIADRSNARALDVVESALFVVHLLPALSSLAMLSPERRCWLDKSVALLVAADGAVSLRAELACCEPEIFASYWRWLAPRLTDAAPLPPLPTAASFSVIQTNAVFTDACAQVGVAQLHWTVTAPLADECDDAVGYQTSVGGDVQLAHCDLDASRCPSCPFDAVALLALLLAYRRVHDAVPRTRQRVSLRRFRCGRSDHVRPLLPDLLPWLLAMHDDQASPADRSRLLRQALDVVRRQHIDAARRGGFDNHLAALHALAVRSDAPLSAFFERSPFALSPADSDLLVTQLDTADCLPAMCPPAGTGYAVVVARSGHALTARVTVTASSQDPVQRNPQALIAILPQVFSELLVLL